MFDLKGEKQVLTDIEITITGTGFIPGELKNVIADMVHDYLVEQGVLCSPAEQLELKLDI